MKSKIIFTKGSDIKTVRESSLLQIEVIKNAGWIESVKTVSTKDKDKKNGEK